MDRRDARPQRRAAGRARHGPRFRMRVRPRDPSLARHHGCGAVRVGLQPVPRAVVRREPFVRRLPRQPARAAAAVRGRLLRPRLLPVDLHAPRRRAAGAMDRGADAGDKARRRPATHLSWSQPGGGHAHRGQYEQIAPGFDAGELVVIEGEQSGSSECATYHPERYIREVLGQGLELLDFSPGGALDIQQDAVLFRKPDQLAAAPRDRRRGRGCRGMRAAPRRGRAPAPSRAPLRSRSSVGVSSPAPARPRRRSRPRHRRGETSSRRPGSRSDCRRSPGIRPPCRPPFPRSRAGRSPPSGSGPSR